MDVASSFPSVMQFAGIARELTCNRYARRASDQIEIRTEYTHPTSTQRYCHTNLHGKPTPIIQHEITLTQLQTRNFTATVTHVTLDYAMTSVLKANIKNKERVFLTSDMLSDRSLGRKHKNGTVLLCVPDLRRRTC
jgi:hypothetical protein